MAEPTDAERAKEAAGRAAASLVRDGMRVGLGTGSTAECFIRALGERVREEDLIITAVGTSRRSEALAADLDIPLATLDELGELDLTVDGTDEFDRELRLIKGGGGALLREKIVASASRRMVVIADEGKEVAWLGGFALPVEVIPFGEKATRMAILETLEALKLLNKKITRRMSGDLPFVTDQGNHILDLHLTRIPDPSSLAAALNAIAGVVEHGLFIGMADRVLIGYADGRVDVRKR